METWTLVSFMPFGTVTGLRDSVKVGYDNNSDNDIDDAGDDLVTNEDFGGTSVTPAHDHAGNLVEDGSFRYTYDAWNRLVKLQAKEDNAAVTIQTAEFDGLGRRIKKVVILDSARRRSPPAPVARAAMRLGTCQGLRKR